MIPRGHHYGLSSPTNPPVGQRANSLDCACREGRQSRIQRRPALAHDPEDASQGSHSGREGRFVTRCGVASGAASLGYGACRSHPVRSFSATGRSSMNTNREHVPRLVLRRTVGAARRWWFSKFPRATPKPLVELRFPDAFGFL